MRQATWLQQFAQMSDHDAFTLEEDDMPHLASDSDDDDDQHVVPSPTDTLTLSDALAQNWFVDSGATAHATSEINNLSHVQELDDPLTRRLASADAPLITCCKTGKAYLISA